MLRSGLVAVILTTSALSARAEAIQAKDMMFILPRIGHAWDQKTFGIEGKVIVDEPSAPTLTIVLFYPKREGSLDQVMSAAEADLKGSAIRIGGKAAQSFKVGKLAESTINGATVRMGDGTLDATPVLVATLQRDKASVVLVGIAKNDKAKEQFTAIVKSLEPPAKKATPAPDNEDAGEPMPKLGRFAALKDITASSTFADKSKKDLYGAWRVLDYETTEEPEGLPKTAWCEGKKDEGIGEGITINFAAPTKIDNVDIAAGVWLSEKLYKANNQITSLAISVDGGAAKKVAPPAAHGEWLEVPIGKAVSSLKVTIDTVKKGKMNDSCISAVRLRDDEGEIATVRGLEPKAVAALPAAYDAVVKAISTPDRAGLEKLVTFPFIYESSDWFFDGTKPVRHANWKSIEAACKKQKRGCPGAPNTGGRDDAASVAQEGAGGVVVTFPSRREVADTWHFVWVKGEWKLSDMVSGSP